MFLGPFATGKFEEMKYNKNMCPKNSALLKTTSIEKKSVKQNGSALTTLRTYGVWFSKASKSAGRKEEMLTNEPCGFPVTINSQAANKEEQRLAICDIGKIR